jgi:hypothetical protein
MVSFPLISPLKPCMHLSSPPYVPHVLPISVFLTWSPEWYLVIRYGEMTVVKAKQQENSKIKYYVGVGR